MNRRLRKHWFLAHRWLGLTVGLLFVLVGITGSILVFHHTIDEWLNPKLLLTAPGGSPKTIDEVITSAQTAVANESLAAQFMDVPRNQHSVWTVWFPKGTKDAPGFTQVYVDPYTAEVTGRRIWGEYFITWMYRLHYRLLAGRTGEIIVGISGILVMVSVTTGLYLWWPLWKHSWRAAFAVRGRGRFNYDLHKTMGLISSLILLVVAFSGVYLIFPEWIKPCITFLSPQTASSAKRLQSNVESGLPPIGPDRAVAIAQQVSPDAELKRLYLPTRPEGVYVARVRQPGEVRRSSGNSRVWIEQYTGEVLAVRDWNTRTSADAFFAWQFPLHNGEAFGLIGRWIVFASGPALAVLYVTGVLLWWRKRRSRKRQLRRSQARSDVGLHRRVAVETNPTSAQNP